MKKRVIEVASLYRKTSCQHISEIIMEQDGVCISAKSVIRILKENGMDLACAHHGVRKRRLRERRKKRGELVQIDASPFDWLSDGTMRSLHGAIDDASGDVMALWLTETEQLNGYFHVLEIMIRTSGIPRALYMDGHTIFFSPIGEKLTVEEELEGKTVVLTQFGNVLDILGIQPIRASSPQAKGRVERLWGTLQKRLPVDMRMAGIQSVEEANRFFSEYVKRHNDHFAVEVCDAESAFLPGPPTELMRFILCVRENRKTAGDSSISWKNKTYVIEEKDGEQKLFSRGSTISVLTLMDGSIVAQHGEEIFSVREIAKSTKAEKQEEEKRKLKKTYKPAPDHPWRKYDAHPKRSKKSPKTAA